MDPKRLVAARSHRRSTEGARITELRTEHKQQTENDAAPATVEAAAWRSRRRRRTRLSGMGRSVKIDRPRRNRRIWTNDGHAYVALIQARAAEANSA